MLLLLFLQAFHRSTAQDTGTLAMMTRKTGSVGAMLAQCKRELVIDAGQSRPLQTITGH
jgi:hypothetical protein